MGEIVDDQLAAKFEFVPGRAADSPTQLEQGSAGQQFGQLEEELENSVFQTVFEFDGHGRRFEKAGEIFSGVMVTPIARLCSIIIKPTEKAGIRVFSCAIKIFNGQHC